MAKREHATAQGKTNAMRILDGLGIEYGVQVYEVDESDLSGTHVADELGQPYEQVFKTLVLVGSNKENIVCCIPVNEELDFKKVAKAANLKSAEMIPLKTLTQVTGYMRGGCSPLGMKRQFRTFIDETAVLFESIAVSAGRRGEQMIVRPDDLAAACNANFADIVR